MGYPIFTIEGRLAADPEIRWTNDGTAVTTFAVACSDRYKNQQTNQWEDTEALYIRCQAWKNRAENIANQLRKGTPVLVVGKLKPNNWEKDGQKHYQNIFEVYNIAQILTQQQPQQANQQQQRSYGWNDPNASEAWNQPTSDTPPF